LVDIRCNFEEVAGSTEEKVELGDLPEYGNDNCWGNTHEADS
jgi:hypothetical protein